MSEPSVGTVIPVRDCEAYLAEAVESVLGQTHRPQDVVVVDDGSTDGSRAVAERYAPNVRCVVQSQGGIGAARNRGASEVDGDFLAFLDADDLWAPDKLERQLAAMARRPELGLVFGHVRQFVSPDLSPSDAARLHCPAEPQAGYLAPVMLVRRHAWDRVGPFSTSTVVSEFLDWLLRAREAGVHEEMLPHVLLHRRLHMTNNSRRHRDSITEYARTLKLALDRRRV
jgi:glycosyltransferase involved in cell wall biosynthesis